MRRVAVILLIVFALFFFVFQKADVRITNKINGSPVSYALINNGTSAVYADKNGKASFFHSIFQRNISVSRIGFEEGEFSLPSSFLFSKSSFDLAQADFQSIQRQINKSFSDLSSYKYQYTLTTEKNGKTQTQTISAYFNKGDFEFENKSDFTGSDYKVMYKKNQFYLFKDGKWNKLSGTEKDNFVNQNIVFISISDLIDSIFPSDNPNSINCSYDKIDIAWDHTNMDLIVSKDGFISSIIFNNNSSTQKTSVTVKIENVNEKVSIPDE